MTNAETVVAPIFPLPNVVFFPYTFLPLHIFERRYRQMVEDALDGERLIAMVLAEEERPPGSRPAIHGIGTMGTIEIAEPQPGGRWNIVLKGVARARIGRLAARPKEYFVADLDVLGDALPDLQDPAVAERTSGFLLTARRYLEQVLEGEAPDDLLTESVPYPVLVNRAASILQLKVSEKQALLCLDDVGERADRVEAAMKEQLASRSAIELFRSKRPRDPRLN